MQEVIQKSQVLLFYLYTAIDAPEELASRLRTLCKSLQLMGRIIIAEEGINGTVEGDSEQTDAFVKGFVSDERFRNIQIKKSEGNGKSFPKLSVRVRTEIVRTGYPSEVDPRIRTGTHLSPEDLRTWYENGEDFVVVDMRNNYEYASGHFKDSIQTNISAARHLPLAVGKLAPLKNKKVVTVCTGGVRCEKMSAYLLHEGFENVYQLDGGIHSYMEQYPGKDFLGTLYTFDQRLTMHFGGEREIVGSCRLCGSKTELYNDCANDTCHLHFLACESCIDKDGKAFCSDVCKN